MKKESDIKQRIAEDTGQAVPGLQGGWARLVSCLLAGIPLAGLLYAFSVPSYFGYALWGEQAALAVLGLGLGATFLIKPARARFADRPRPAWYDVTAAMLALLLCAWTAVRYEWLVSIGFLGTGADYYINLIVAGLTLLLVLEALRRLTGMAMVALVLASLAYALFAGRMPGAFNGQTPDLDFLIGYLQLDSAGILGTPLSVVVSTVVAYVLLGNALFRLGGGQLFLDLPLAAMGRYRGGPAKASVLASSLFGSISGSAVANVATTGIVTIPLMKKCGYRSEQAAAIEAVSSTGGQLLPPIMGAAAFIMAEFLGVSYVEVALAALIPAILFYMALLVQIHLHAARSGIRPMTAEERPDAMRTLRRYWPFLLPIALLLVILFALRWTPEKAAFASLVATFVAAAMVGEHKVGPRAIIGIFEAAGKSLLEIIAITAAAGVIVGVLSITGLSFSLGLSIADMAGPLPIVLLLMAAVTAILFGMGMPTTAVYVLMATLIAPSLVAAGFDPLASHLFVLYFGVLSMITPPVCLASFAAASMAGAPFMRSGWQSVRFGATAFLVPFVFVACPPLLLHGDMAGGEWLAAGLAFVTAMLGFLMIAAAIEAYLFHGIAWPTRILAGLSGLMLIIPEGGALKIFHGIPTDSIGMVLAVVLVMFCWVRSRNGACRTGAVAAVD
ncbi:MAG: TRAP transporter fused permease subunit [Alcanivorax sp.]|nr:TRAP transporter fused permease subunit [Alcanivorax sp.]